MSEIVEVDTVVFGSGAAGMMAALTASVHGMRVLLCEKDVTLGGTTATSGGSCWVPGNHLARERGLPNDIADAERYLDAECGPDLDGARRAYVHGAAEAFEFLERHSHVRFALPLAYPDYHPRVPGASLGARVLQPLPFDGRRLGNDFARIRPPNPGQMILGGMMVNRPEASMLSRPLASRTNLAFASRTLGRYLVDRARHGRGTRLLLGNALVAAMYLSLKERGVDCRTGSALVGLVRDGRVTEALVAGAQGRFRVRARAFVLATGGFTSSPDLRARLAPAYPCDWHLSTQGATGDAMLAAQAIGAAVGTGHKAPMYFMPASVMHVPGGAPFAFPHVIQDRSRPGLVAVDRAGNRFVNEAVSYHDFVLAMFDERNERIPAWLVCDRRYLRDYGLGLVRARFQWLRWYERRGYLVTAGSVGELAGRIGVDPGVLQRTIDIHNRDAADGVDTRFHKGEDALNRFNGDPSIGPNPCLAPIVEAPYCAIRVQPAAIGACLGLATDGAARVLDTAGAPIPGLYAAGNDQDAVMRGAYPGAGITLGPAITFGYRGARHAASQRERPVESHA